VGLFIVLGVLIALVLILRDLRDNDVPEETGTLPAVGAPPRPQS